MMGNSQFGGTNGNLDLKTELKSTTDESGGLMRRTADPR